MVYDGGLFDGKGGRIARPSDAEVARYANNVYNRDGINRRGFLKYAFGAALAASAGGCDKSPTGPDPIPIGSKYSITGNVTGTFGGQLLMPYRISAGPKSYDSADGNFRLENVDSGVYNLIAEDGAVQIRRVRSGVNVGRNMNLDLDAIEAGYSFDIDNYRTMAMGINSPHPFGGAPRNRGNSIRLRPGVNPRVIVVKQPQISDAYYSAINQARSAFGEFTRGILSSAPIDPVDIEPSNLPEGAIVVVFEGNEFLTGVPRLNGFYIQSDKIRITPSITNFTEAYKAMKHEYGHAIGFDHVNDQSSIMRATGLLSHSGILSKNDMDAGYLKYRRNGGHTLSTAEDKD